MKKSISLLLVLVLSVGLLAGCGGGAAPASTAPAAPTGAAASPAAPEAATDAASDEVVTLIWQQIGTPPGHLDQVMEVINEYTREQIGVELDLRFFDWGEWETALPNMLNTGEYYDIAFVQTRFYRGNAMDGKFLDLTELLPGVPALTALIPENVWPGVAMNGAIYGVPTYKDSAATQYFGFDKALVDKYAIDLPSLKALADLEPVLTQIKEGEEAEKGETVYPFPQTTEGYSAIRADYDNYVRYDDETMTAKNTWEQPEVVETLELLHKWWEAGLINPDASTKTDPDLYRICFFYQGFAGSEVNLSIDRGYDIVSTPYTESIYSTESIQGSVNSISANSKYPEKALELLELANTDHTLRDMLAYGIPGVDFQDNGDGTITRLTDTWTAPAYSQATFFTMSPVAPNSAEQWTMVEEQNQNAIGHVLLGFSLDPAPIETEITNVNAILERVYPELLTGAYQGTTADYLANLNTELYNAGLQKILDETQAQINAWKS